MAHSNHEFVRRASHIRPHGVGLSIDIHCPNLGELVTGCDSRRLRNGYLEVFKAPAPALAALRQYCRDTVLEYH